MRLVLTLVATGDNQEHIHEVAESMELFVYQLFCKWKLCFHWENFKDVFPQENSGSKSNKMMLRDRNSFNSSILREHTE